MKSIAAMDYLHFLRDLLTGARTRGELSASQRRKADCADLFALGPLDILDLGNGALRPQSYILMNEGHRVTGVDYVNSPSFSWKTAAYVLARMLFRMHLPRSKAPVGALQLVTADAAALPFPDESFDLITSFAAFEHFMEVDKVVRECSRVLKPGGMVWIGIHCFPALSGGHNVGRRRDELTELPPGIEPWDHLRNQKLPFTVPLNRLRPREYSELFERFFDITIAECIGKEGEELLTPEIQNELSEYSREELLCACYLICGKKPSGSRTSHKSELS
jgi:SAM-dependent methyltransferase